MTSQYNPDHLSPTQLWGLGVSSLLTEMNRCRHDVLRHHDDTDDVRHFVQRDWGIGTRQELLDMLNWLGTEGHNKSYLNQQHFINSLSERALNAYIHAHQHDENRHAQLLILKNYRFTLRKGGIGAWDDGRYVSLCRWGVILDLMSEQECWELILRVAQRVQAAYRDWYSFGVSYVAGRLYWKCRATQDSAIGEMHVVRRLTGNPQSPWNRLDWHESLI